jgi:hypothetical protein
MVKCLCSGGRAAPRPPIRPKNDTANWLTIKHRPARFIAQALVIKHKVPDFVWKLLALPLALLTGGTLALAFRSRGVRCPDCVGCRAQLMRCHVRDRHRLAGRKGRKLCRTGKLPSRGVGDKGHVMGLAHWYFTSRPGVDQVNRLARTFIVRLRFLEEVQHMFRAGRCPERKKMVIGIAQGAATTNGDKSGIAGLGKNHGVLLERACVYGGESVICFDRLYAVARSPSFCTSTRPRMSTLLSGEEIRFIPGGTDPRQPGPVMR